VLRRRLSGVTGAQPRVGPGAGWLLSRQPAYPVDCALPHLRNGKRMRAKGTANSTATAAGRRILVVSSSLVCLDARGQAEPEWPHVLCRPGRAFARWHVSEKAVAAAVEAFEDGVPGPADPAMLDLSMIVDRTSRKVRERLEAAEPDGSLSARAPLPRVRPQRARIVVAPLRADESAIETSGVRVTGLERDERLVVNVRTERPLADVLEETTRAVEHVLAHRYLLAVGERILDVQGHYLSTLLDQAKGGSTEEFAGTATELISAGLLFDDAVASAWGFGQGVPSESVATVRALDIELDVSEAWRTVSQRSRAIQRSFDLAVRLQEIVGNAREQST